MMLHLSSNRHLSHHASGSTKTDLYAAGGLRSHLKHYWPACPSVPVGPDGRPSEFFPGRALKLRACKFSDNVKRAQRFLVRVN